MELSTKARRFLATLLASAGLACGTAEPSAAGQGVTVAVSPSVVTVAPTATRQFAALVTGTGNQAVTWGVIPANGGVVDGTGFYTAPSTTGVFQVVATSVADTSVSGSAQVTVSQGGGGSYSMPADRATTWNPGVPGGIPSYTVLQGAVIAAGATAATIQARLDAAGTAAAGDGVGRVVQLGAGTFTLSNDLEIPSKVVLRGAGPGSTRLVASSRSVQRYLILFSNSPWPGSTISGSTNLTVNGSKGSTSVTVASASGITVGSLVLIDELTDTSKVWWHPSLTGADRGWYCRINRPISQMLRVTQVAGNVITFAEPLHIDFRTAFTAQLSRFSIAPIWDAGIEDLRVGSAGQEGSNSAAITFGLSGRCWAKHVEVDDVYGSGVAFSNAYRAELRDSYLHDATVFQNGGFAYGIDVTQSTSDSLLENNICLRWNKVMNMRAAGGGNVVAYNYMDDGGIYNAPDWVESGLSASHYPTTQHVLFEGNFSFNADGESTEGNAIYLTFFRNHLSCNRRLAYDSADLALLTSLHPPSGGSYADGGNVRCAGAMRSHYWYSYVGNVLGRAGVNYSSWLTDDRASGRALDQAIWHLGTWDQDYNLRDTQVAGTMLRDGNFDFKSNSQVWSGVGEVGSTPATLPDSLYLRSKPAFFGSSPWPWVTPEGASKTATLPAKARYDAGTPNG